MLANGIKNWWHGRYGIDFLFGFSSCFTQESFQLALWQMTTSITYGTWCFIIFRMFHQVSYPLGDSFGDALPIFPHVHQPPSFLRPPPLALPVIPRRARPPSALAAGSLVLPPPEIHEFFSLSQNPEMENPIDPIQFGEITQLPRLWMVKLQFITWKSTGIVFETWLGKTQFVVPWCSLMFPLW